MPQTRFSAQYVIRDEEGNIRHPFAQLAGYKPPKIKDKQTDNPLYPTFYRTRETYAERLKRSPSAHAMRAQFDGSYRRGKENKSKPNRN